jgi:hypothetical protein
LGENMDDDQIVIYWWNMGKKTLDYKGSYKEYLTQKGIKCGEILGRQGWWFRIPLVGAKADLEIQGNWREGCDAAIRVFLTLLGDRATLYTSRRKYCINWNG